VVGALVPSVDAKPATAPGGAKHGMPRVHESAAYALVREPSEFADTSKRAAAVSISATGRRSFFRVTGGRPFRIKSQWR